MSDDRRTHLAEVAATLWPAPHTAVLGRGPDRGDVVGEFLVLPSRSRPRLLAPTGPRAAAAVVRHHGEGRHARARLGAAVLALGLRAGVGSLLRHDRLTVTAPEGGHAASLVGLLAEVLGREVAVGMHLGPPRANRKPVLQLLDRTGRTLAYAKVAVDDLTDELVRTEASALSELRMVDTRVVQVAELLYQGTWQERSLLVQSALPVWAPRRPLTADRHVAAVAEVASIGRRDGVPLGATAFWAGLTTRVSGLPGGPAAGRLLELVRRLGRLAGDVPLSLGAAHGDWTPWNTACLGNRLLVWDWERFRRGVPVGFDLLHHGLQTDLVVRSADAGASAGRTVREAPDRLRPLGVAPRAALVTALLYGADLAARYLADRQQEAGAQFGDVGEWLLPALLGGIDVLEGDQR